jgi:trimeric autotransporter adhesin
MKIHYYFSIAVFACAFNHHVFSQNIGINTDGTAPHASSMLDIKSTDKGLLIPRVSLTGTSDATTIASPAASLLVYNLATVSDVTPGYYYWSGTVWTRLNIPTDLGAGTGIDISGTTISMEDMPANTIKGNNTAAAAAPTDIVIPANTVLGRRGAATNIVAAQVVTAQIANLNVTTAKIADANVTTAKIADANVTNAKLANMDEALIKGRAAAAGTGVPQDLTAAEVRTILNVADGATANPGTVTSIATGTGLTGGAITGSGTISMANMAALSVKGNATNAVAAPTDIAAASDHQVLRRSGTTIGFGAVNLAQGNAVTGTLPVGNGGTGLTAPGAAGNVLVSNGTSWTSGNAAEQFIQNQSAAVQTGTFWINGVGRVGDGTAAAPSLSFNSNAATGLFRAGANIIGFSSNGTERWRIDAAGILQSNGAQTIRTSTGNLTVATAAGNGNIYLTPHGTGKTLVNTTTVADFNTGPSGSTVHLQVHGNIGMSNGLVHTITALGRLRIAAYGNRTNASSDLSDDIVFMTTTSHVNRMVIKNQGNVGIGDDYNNAPNRLSVRDGLTGYVMRVENTNTTPAGANVIDCVGGGSSGDIFIAFRRTSSGDVIGSITRNGSSNVAFNQSSDLRLKENITESKEGLSVISKLNVVDYNYIDDDKENRVTGFIAQEAHKVIPSAVTVGGEDVKEKPWGIDYSKLTPYLTKAIQEQQALIEELQLENQALKSANQNMEDTNASLQHHLKQLEQKLDQLTKLVNVLHQSKVE